LALDWLERQVQRDQQLLEHPARQALRERRLDPQVLATLAN